MNVLKAFKLSAVAAVLVCTASAAFAAESEFSYAGYLRVGYAYTNGLYGYDGNFGLTGKNGGAEKWTGRLGKEANAQYLENTFMNTFTVEGGAWAKLFVTLTCESFNPGTDAQNATVGGTTAGGDKDIKIRNRQAYVEMGGLGFSPDTSFWVGRRFYHREDIHILDYYVLDYSGDGAGIENIAKSGISIAIMSHQYIKDGEDDTAVKVATVNGKAKGTDQCSTGVLQYKNKYMRFDGTYSYRPKQAEESARNGQTASLTVYPDQFFFIVKGNSSIIAQYGRGSSAENIWWGNRYTNMADHSAHTNRYAYAYDVMATGLIQASDEVQISTAVGYVDFHSTPDRILGLDTAKYKGTGDVSRFFAVIRPHVNFSKNVAFELEAGYYRLAATKAISGGAASASWCQNMGLETGQKSNWSAKVTPALVLTLDNGFWTRPALRLFGSYEKVGKKTPSNTVNYDKKQCISYGFQVEAWW